MATNSFITFAHHLDNANHPFISLVIVAIFLLCWLTAAVLIVRSWFAGSKRPINKPLFYGAVLLGAVVISAEFLISEVAERAALLEIRPWLFEPVNSVEVNGSRIENPASFVTALQNIQDVMGHHSHPTVRYRVVLHTSSGSFALLLLRDSGDHDEYWVSNPTFHNGYIGRVYTNALD